jgi:YYY domain-containing protein
MSEIEPTPAPQPEPAVTAASAAPSTSANAAPAAPRSVNPAFILHPSSFYSLALDIFLILLIALGIFFRFNWSNWSQGTDLHPDEYGLTSTLTQLHIPDTLGDYFNTRLSSMSPYQKYDIDGNPIAPSADYPMPNNRLPWGQWPLTIIRFTAEVTGQTGYSELRLMGRHLSALFDTLSLLLIFLIGWQLFNRRVGLMAAALSALAVMQIQQSHFMTVDNFSVFFTMCTMLCAVMVAKGDRRLPGGQWTWYGLFGVFFGMAVASRINLAPLAAEIIVAAFIAYARDWNDRKKDLVTVATEAGLRLALAGIVSLLSFRVTQPMSFRAETGDTTLLTVHLNPEWTASLAASSDENSGIGAGPPGEQWTNRPAIIFPWINMVFWGMGLPLGLVAWAGLLWAVWRVFQADDDKSWRQHLLPLTWAGGYFLFMGTRWVKSIRYFLPIYPFMALFAAWAIWALWQKRKREAGGRKLEAGNGRSWSSFQRPASIFQYLSVVLGAVVLLGTLAWAWGFTGIYRTDNTRIQASRWIYQNVPGPFNVSIATDNGQTYHEPLPAPDGATIQSEGPYPLQFTSHVTGTVTGFSLAYAMNPGDPHAAAGLHVVLASDPGGQQVLAQGDATVPPQGADPRGTPVQAPLGPAALEQGKTYYLLVTAANGGQVTVHGSTVANESWDEGLPLRLDGRDAFGGLYTGLTSEVRWEDNEDKRNMFFDVLSRSDYLFLPSQRAIWAASRLPSTYPMTIAYYKALFNGSLGFDLVQEFQTPITLGPLEISDIGGTVAWGQKPALSPAKDFPFNFNSFAAEEAFSVYDHAPVWIFKKRADFSQAQMEAVLNAIDLTAVVNQGPVDATKTPTLLRLTPERLAEQTAGGTWSQIFNFDSLVNQNEFVGVVVWYLAILLIGWLAWPLAFLAFGGLSDKGYALARTVGLLIVTWLVWIVASYRVLPFTRGTILLGLLVMAAASGLVYWRRRAEINAWVRAHRRYMLVVEGVVLALFLLDLFIRWGNPDLWHPYYGGEKPMVFSFFNAVLKSTSFPPFNPWLAGYYLNYYYYGFVIVAIPTKLLGIVPAFAYNLILPTLFSMVGINAFGVAFNLVAAARGVVGRRLVAGNWKLEVGRQRADGEADTERVGGSAPVTEIIEAHPTATFAEAGAPVVATAEPVVVEAAVAEPGVPSNGEAALELASPQTGPNGAADSESSLQPPASLPTSDLRPPASRLASPYLAGIAAALLVVVLGNLAQVYVFINGFQKSADHAALASSALGDNDVSAAINGFWRVATGQTTIALGTGEWYWNATRIVTILNKGGQEITEFPFFTFLYADMHAHMMDMPFTLLALAWAVSYIFMAARPAPSRRQWLEWVAVFFTGGLALGVARATNTWDYPLFLVFGALAVIVGEWLRDPRFTKANLFRIAWRLLLLVGLVLALYHPFDQWFAAAYSKIQRYTDTHEPISAFLYIYGLFLFIIVSYLALETQRWLAETPASVLTRAADWLPLAGVALGGVLIIMAILWYLQVPIGLIAVPIIAWAGLLMLRGEEAMPLARRLVLFLIGTALAVTVFVELFTLQGDRMNTIFKFYIQVWVILAVVGGAALAWAVASLPSWSSAWRTGWSACLALLVGAAGLYTVTAASAKMTDRFPVMASTQPGQGCAPIQGMQLPYSQGLPPEQQPHSLYGLDYMTWSAYCDHDSFLPLSYDNEAIRWMQDNVQGSPVIVEAQSFDLYRMSSRYTWNTGLPDVVGWDYHTRQHNAAIPTEFVTTRGNEIIAFYSGPDIPSAMAFLQRYNARYVIVGPMEQAYYGPSGGLAKFDAMVSQGLLKVVHQNPGVTIYQVNQTTTGAQ